MVDTRQDTEETINAHRANRRQFLTAASAIGVLLVTPYAAAAGLPTRANAPPATLFGGGPCEGL